MSKNPNWKPSKKSIERIDGIVALIMPLDCASTQPPAESSVYKLHGLLTVHRTFLWCHALDERRGQSRDCSAGRTARFQVRVLHDPADCDPWRQAESPIYPWNHRAAT